MDAAVPGIPLTLPSPARGEGIGRRCGDRNPPQDVEPSPARGEGLADGAAVPGIPLTLTLSRQGTADRTGAPAPPPTPDLLRSI